MTLSFRWKYAFIDNRNKTVKYQFHISMQKFSTKPVQMSTVFIIFMCLSFYPSDNILEMMQRWCCDKQLVLSMSPHSSAFELFSSEYWNVERVWRLFHEFDINVCPHNAWICVKAHMRLCDAWCHLKCILVLPKIVFVAIKMSSTGVHCLGIDPERWDDIAMLKHHLSYFVK